MKYLLNTNICAYFINQTHPAVADRIRSLRRNRLGVSAITWAELWHGAEGGNRREIAAKKLAVFADAIGLLPFDHDAAVAAGAVLASLRRAGTPIGPYDALIAGHALALGATLVTHNTREFQRVKGLKLADWTLPSPSAK